MKKSSGQYSRQGQGKARSPQAGAPRHGTKTTRDNQPAHGNSKSIGTHKNKPFDNPKPSGTYKAKNSMAKIGHKPARIAVTVPKKEQVRRPGPTLASANNPPRRLGEQLLHGFHAVQAAWLNPQRQCHQLWLTTAGTASFAPVLAAASAAGLRRPAPQTVERTMLDGLLPGAVHQGIVLDVAPLPETSLDALLASEPKLLLLLDQVTDPHNVGAILRSAAAFGADAVLLTDRHAPGQGGVLAKTASGALEHVPLVTIVNLARTMATLRAAGFWCIGLAEEGTQDIAAHDMSGKTALVLGAEGEGLRHLTRERCDALARLPTQGAIGSLNVSNAAAVALYEVKRQIGLTAGKKTS